jgi:hypothetical protein
LRVGGFQDRCLKPLGHPSKLAKGSAGFLLLGDAPRKRE